MSRKNLLVIFVLAGVTGAQAVAQTAPAPAATTPVAPAASAPAASAPAATPAATTGGRGNARGPMASRVITWDSLTPTRSAVGAGRTVFNGPTTTLNNFEMHITTVDVGKGAHAPHTHGNEEMLIVKEGTLEVYINGKTYVAPTGSIIYYSSNDQHGTKNIGNVPATYYVINWRTDKTPATITPNADTVKQGQDFYTSTGAYAPAAPAAGNTTAK